MGNTDTKLNFRKAVVQLTTRTQPVEATDDAFWNQFWSDSTNCIQDIFTLIPAAEIRALREESPSNLATLCCKAVARLARAAESGCRSQRDEQMVQNCVRLLTRILPYIFEDTDWKGFFWSTLPSQSKDDTTENDNDNLTLAQSLISSLSDLLFCPDFTVAPNKKPGPDNPEDMSSIDSCEYIWAAGVGFTQHTPNSAHYDINRTEILKLLLTCFSEVMYLPPITEVHVGGNKWISYFTSTENRHILPLFTSLLNIVCSYDPVGYGMPYNYLMLNDTREPLVEVALHVLCVTLDSEAISGDSVSSQNSKLLTEIGGSDNLFVNYLSRIHRDEDFAFILNGLTRLLNNPLTQTYLPASCKRIHFHQELLVFFWKICDINKKFMYYVLKSSDVLEVLVPILYYLNTSKTDPSHIGLMHIGVFILLLLSGERNFGVRLNKPYTARAPIDVPVFTGSHADLLILVFHKIIICGQHRLQPLFDCLLTIIVNVSPYLKTLSMTASAKLLHLLEAFSTPSFLFNNASNHHLMFFMLEVFNNIIQYQFDGNSNLIYTVIRKRAVFHQLASLPSDHASILKAISKSAANSTSKSPRSVASEEDKEAGSDRAEQLQAATVLQATLAATPGIDKMTEKTEAITLTQTQTETNPESPPRSRNPTFSGDPNCGPSNDGEKFGSSDRGETIGKDEEEKNGKVNESIKDNGMEKHAEPSKIASGTSSLKSFSPPRSPTDSIRSLPMQCNASSQRFSISNNWLPTSEWVKGWKQKLPLQTIMRLLQVLVPQVEKICIDRGLTDEVEILRFLQHGTLVGLLPVPHPILIRKYQANAGTTMWFRTYLWGVIYLRNVDPPIWYDTDVKLFEIQRV